MPSHQEQSLALLAKHHPCVFGDLHLWLASRQTNEQHFSQTVNNFAVRSNGVHYLTGVPDPALDIEFQRQVDPSDRVVRVFDNAQEFIQFLAHPDTASVIAQPQWRPWLMMPLDESKSMQEFLTNCPLSDWPWGLANSSSKAAVCEASAQQLNRDLEYAIDQRKSVYQQNLLEKYRGHPTVCEILTQQKRSLRVMIFVPEESAYQRYCGRDLHDACREAGLESTLIVCKPSMTWEVDLLQSIEQNFPDLFIVISKCRQNFPNLPEELSILMWDQDHRCTPDPNLGKHVGSRDRLKTLLEEWQSDAIRNGANAKQVAHLNLGFNPRVFYKPNAPVKHEYDVLFIGNIHPFEKYKDMIDFYKWAPAAQKVMLHARDRLFAWIESRDENERFIIPPIDQFMNESAKAIGAQIDQNNPLWPRSVRYFRYRLAHYVVRQCFVEALADFRLGLFGDGWHHFPKVAHIAQPSITNGEEMLHVMHRSAIHMQLHTWTVHHPRLYDTAGAGGFLLVGRVPEAYPLDRAFTPGQEVETFGSIAELRQKVRHYLDHPEVRQAMADRAFDRGMAEHTMLHRVNHLLNDLRSHAA